MSFRCNLVIPGFPKCGTSSLHEYLDMHPDICMSNPKEPALFNKGSSTCSSIIHNEIFEECSTATYFGESSTTYCISELACSRIYDSLIDPKIIILLREPVARTVSHYKWLCALGFETRSMGDAIDKDGYDFDYNYDWGGNYKSYLQFSGYYKYVRMWIERFGKENVLLIRTEDLAESPGVVLDTVWSFLDLDPIKIGSVVESNKTSEITSMKVSGWIAFLMNMMPRWAVDAIRINKEKFHWMKKIVYVRASVRPIYNQEDINDLNQRLAEDISFYSGVFSLNDRKNKP